MAFIRNNPQLESYMEYVQKIRDYIIVCRFLKDIWSHTQTRVGENTLTYFLPKGNLNSLMMLNQNTKEFVHSPTVNTSFFDAVSRVVQVSRHKLNVCCIAWTDSVRLSTLCELR